MGPMFPFRDHNPSESTPYVTWALIIANILIFISYSGLSSEPRLLGQFYSTWGIVPFEVAQGRAGTTLLTSMFLHGGLLHLGGNMLFLWIFGDNLEDALGRFRFLGFYLICGLGAGLLQVAVAPYSTVPVVGASGAVAGVMGGYLLLYPRAKIDVLLVLIIYIRVIPVAAWMMLGLWLGMQLFGGFAETGNEGGVAYWAHVGGFVVGFILVIPLWLRRGGTKGWQKTHGLPPHPEAKYRFARSNIPRVRHRKTRRGPWG